MILDKTTRNEIYAYINYLFLGPMSHLSYHTDGQ